MGVIRIGAMSQRRSWKRVLAIARGEIQAEQAGVDVLALVNLVDARGFGGIDGVVLKIAEISWQTYLGDLKIIFCLAGILGLIDE